MAIRLFYRRRGVHYFAICNVFCGRLGGMGMDKRLGTDDILVIDMFAPFRCCATFFITANSQNEGDFHGKNYRKILVFFVRGYLGDVYYLCLFILPWKQILWLGLTLSPRYFARGCAARCPTVKAWPKV